MKFDEKTPLVIVGAGLGGLTFALACQKLGIPCIILEKQPRLSEIGAGITLWENALKVLQELGALEAISAISRPNAGGTIATADGQILVNASLAEPSALGRLWAVHRVELQEALHQCLSPDIVRFGLSFDTWQESASHIALHLTDGSTLSTPLVVGADGIHSRVRQQLFDDEPLRYAGYAAYRGVCKRPRDLVIPVGEVFGPGTRFGAVELSQERVYWYAALSQPVGTPRAVDAQAYLLERFADYAFDVPRVLEATPQEAILYHDLFDRPPSGRFYRGRGVLLGDAAHPTTPNMGQGAAMAMESALILARALAQSEDVDDALLRYQKLRAPRTTRVTNMSRTIGQVAQLKNPILRALRDRAFRLMPQRSRNAQLEWVAGYDAASAALF